MVKKKKKNAIFGFVLKFQVPIICMYVNPEESLYNYLPWDPNVSIFSRSYLMFIKAF